MVKRAIKTQQERIKREKFQRQQFYELYPKNENQQKFLESMKYDTVCVGEGSAGVGKTFLACWYAAKKLHYGDIKKVILLRAYQPLAGRSIGLLPGTATEKLQSFYQQMIEYFEDFLGKAQTEIAIKTGTLEICSLETIRGRSWSDCIVICDESQNLYVQEVQAISTRIGDNCQIIFCGDDSGLQSDIKKGMNGLSYLKKIIDKYQIPEVSFVKFTKEDVVRSGVTRSFVFAYEDEFELDKQSKGILTDKGNK